MAFIAAVGHKQLGPDWAIGSPSSLGHNRYGEVVPEESAAQQQREFYVVQKRHAMTQQQAERSQPHHFARREGRISSIDRKERKIFLLHLVGFRKTSQGLLFNIACVLFPLGDLMIEHSQLT